MPAVDGYTGKRGMPYASWGIGVSEGSENKEAAWKLVEYLMSPEVNSKLVTIANAFPGNVNAKPDLSKSDPLFSEAFEIYQEGYLANEFVGLPVAEELMRQMDVEVQKLLEGQADRAGSGRRHAGAVGGRIRQVGDANWPGSATRAAGAAGSAARSRPDRRGTAWPTPSRMRPARRPGAASAGLISYKASRRLVPLLYVTPATLLFCLLMLFPMVMVFRYSLLDGAILKKNAAFVGLQNFREVFADPVFWESVGNTLYFTVMSVIFHLLIGLAFALLLNSDRINPVPRSILRVLFILPWLFTAVIIAIIWRLLLDPNGVINSVLMALHIVGFKVEWFSSPQDRAPRPDLRQHLGGLPALHGEAARRPAGHPQGPLRSGQHRRRERAREVLAHHRAAADADHRQHRASRLHLDDAGLPAGLDDDRRRARSTRPRC